jgi:hypothetical protein
MTLMNAEPAEASPTRPWPNARGAASQSLLRAGIAAAAAGLFLFLICGLAHANASASLSVEVIPSGSPPPSSFEPAGCQPSNHGLVRGRPSIQTINGAPVLVTDSGCLLVAYDAFATSQGYEGSTFVSSPGFDQYDAAFGVNQTWVQQVRDIGHYNAIATAQFLTNPAQTATCQYVFPFTNTLDQFVATAQNLLSLASANGLYLIIMPFNCSDWTGGSLDPSWDITVWTRLAQTFGSNTNVIFQQASEPEGEGNFSCDLNSQINDSNYLTIRQFAPNSMFLPWGEFSFSGPPNCGDWASLTSGATSTSYSNAASSWSSIHTFDNTVALQQYIQAGAALGQAMWSLEGPESPDNCAFGTDAALTSYIQTLMSNNTGWQCDDGWPNAYGPNVPFWPAD